MTSATNKVSVNPTTTEEKEPLEITTGVYVTIHGHFYQPPRENPYLNTIERQPSAYPFHNWNERIHHECYRPNAFARILNDEGEVMGIVNNFEYLSFNIGPTLMSWLERYDVEVYQRILEADRLSCEKFNGHGNAIAQVYNHIILPLANKRDKHTQIRWGKEDFRSRFQRDPEGMWLAETAVDYPTLEALIDEGIQFIILAPSQAERCRPLNDENAEWFEVGGSQIDPTRPYRCFINDGRYIDIFFYDGPISRDMGFDQVLSSSHNLVGRLGQAVRGDHRPAQLIHAATDGETFGHHKGGTEKCLAYAFTQEFPRRGWSVTNYSYYLHTHPPAWEVVLKPVTAWSCSHGVDRWQDDCGCGGGGLWNQKWRKPLRNTLNWLRDKLAVIYENTGGSLLRDPWLARDEYIEVIRDRTPEKVDSFLRRHQTHKLSPAEQIDALRLLEMQRHTLLMYTSCGWFFEELSRPEGVQILRYAARAVELAAEVAGVQLEKEFIRRLKKAPSNVELFGDGAEVFRQLVVSSQITFQQIAAHYAFSSLLTNYAEEQRIHCYHAHQLDYQRQQLGSLTLAVGQLRLVSEITWESSHLVFAVLHLGGWDFHCCIQPFEGRRLYSQLKEQLFDSFKEASAAQTILTMTKLFGDSSFNLQNLFAEERHRIMEQLTQETRNRLDQLYTQVYRDNYGVLVAFHRDEIPVPQELQVAAEIALSHRCALTVRSLETAADDLQQVDNALAELDAIATEANHMRCSLKVPEAKQSLEQLILRSLWQLLHDLDHDSLAESVQRLQQMVEVGEKLHLGLSLSPAQELYFNWLHTTLIPQLSSQKWDASHQQSLLLLGEKLAVEVTPWLEV